MNAHRGEASIAIRGVTYLLRPTFAALAGLEMEVGASLLSVSERVIEGKMTAIDTMAILRAGIIGGGATPPDDLAEQVASDGYLRVAIAVIAWFRTALIGDPERKEQVKENPPSANPASTS